MWPAPSPRLPRPARARPGPRSGRGGHARPQQPSPARPHPRRGGRRPATALDKSDLPALVARWLDALDETGALGAPQADHRRAAHRRLGAARQDRGGEPRRHRGRTRSSRSGTGSSRPTRSCSPGSRAAARGPNPRDPAPFRPPMLSHPLEDEDFAKLDAGDFMAEWKWDGIRLQAVGGRGADGRLDPPHLLAHRRGRLARLPGPRRGARLRRRARRRAPDPPRRPGAELQRPPAAPQPQEP